MNVQVVEALRGSGHWPSPAALAAGEPRSISGKELIACVVTGYEVCARILYSMDMTFEKFEKISGETSSVFASAAAAGRALGLDEDGMLSNLSMAGIYTPVPGGRKWIGDEGLRPMKEIKQGWAWMCMIGTFTAVFRSGGPQVVAGKQRIGRRKRIVANAGLRQLQRGGPHRGPLARSTTYWTLAQSSTRDVSPRTRR